MEEITVSEGGAHGAYITYLYNGLAGVLTRLEGAAELIMGEERCALRLRGKNLDKMREAVKERVAEVIGIGYKYEFLCERLHVSLSRREKKLLCAALIAADYESDGAYIRRRLGGGNEYSLDGFYRFRMGALQEKWQRIVDYVPEGFSSPDL